MNTQNTNQWGTPTQRSLLLDDTSDNAGVVNRPTARRLPRQIDATTPPQLIIQDNNNQIPGAFPSFGLRRNRQIPQATLIRDLSRQQAAIKIQAVARGITGRDNFNFTLPNNIKRITI